MPEFEAYQANVEFFEDYIDPVSLIDRLYNDETSWLFGALNTNKDPMDPADYGWGKFDQATNTIYGEKVFAFSASFAPLR